MNTILLFKKDLDRYPTSSLRTLQRYLGLPAADKNDLSWLIAIHQAQNNHQGTMKGAAEPTAIDVTDMYAAHTELPISIELEGGDPDQEDVIPTYTIGTTFMFYHPDEEHAKAIAKYVQWSGPDEEVRRMLQPVFERLGEELIAKGPGIGAGIVDLNDNLVRVTRIRYVGRDHLELEDESYVIEPWRKQPEYAILPYQVDVYDDEYENIDFFEMFVPYDPEQLGELYEAAFGTAYVKPARSRGTMKGAAEPENIDVTNLYAGHTELPINVKLMSEDGNPDQEDVMTTFMFHHPDEEHAKAIATYVQFSGPDEEVRRMLQPVFERLDEELVAKGLGIGAEIVGVEHGDTLVQVTRIEYAGRDHLVPGAMPKLEDESFVIKPDYDVQPYQVDVHDDYESIDFFEMFVPYDPEQLGELYEAAFGTAYVKPARS